MSGEAMELELFPEACGGSIPTSPLQFKVVEIDKPIAWSIYKKHHYFGEKDFISLYSFGLLFDGEIWGAITFGSPNAKEIKGLYTKDDQNGILEIVRLATRPESPRNTPSRFIAVAIKKLKQKFPLRLLITYADTAQNHTGGIYKASGFEYHGLTAPKTDLIWPDGRTRRMAYGQKTSDVVGGTWVPRSRKHLFSKAM